MHIYMYYIFAKTLCQYAPLFFFLVPKVLVVGHAYAHGEQNDHPHSQLLWNISSVCAHDGCGKKKMRISTELYSTRRLYCVPCSKKKRKITVYTILEDELYFLLSNGDSILPRHPEQLDDVTPIPSATTKVCL